jgi:site-specific DNA recombinase
MRRSRKTKPGKSPEIKKQHRCAIYTRKSTSAGLEQEFNSLDAQREACEAYIKSQAANGWQPLATSYDDGGFTGANIERPAFQRLLADIRDGLVDIVVVYKVDRLSRSLLDFAQVMNHFNQSGVDFVSITQNFSTADAIGRLTLNMLMSFSEFEREMISERTRDKIAASRRKGKWTGGPVPLGYEVRDKKLHIDPIEGPLVREIFKLYLEHRSVMTVVKTLNRRGKTTKLHQSKTGLIRGGEPWHKNAVLRVLRNPVMAGYISLRDELYDGEHEALVDKDTFHRAEIQMEQHSICKPGEGKNPEYLLTGILRCSCGAACTPSSTRSQGKVYRYYRCVNRDRRGDEVCAARPLPAPSIEDFVLDQLREAVATPEMVQQLEQDLVAKITEKLNDLRKQTRRLKDHVRQRRQELSKARSEPPSVDVNGYDQSASRVQHAHSRLSEAEEALYQAQREKANLSQAQVDAAWIAKILNNFDQVWDLMTPENRQRLVRALVQGVEVDDESGTVEIHLTDLSAQPEKSRQAPYPNLETSEGVQS